MRAALAGSILSPDWRYTAASQ